ncbi:hypothetical protein A3849_24025 [Paenibacillus sp. P46E]|nr:hypothetical protein A3849_24025 [Paenibacillus sp. P46E]
MFILRLLISSLVLYKCMRVHGQVCPSLSQVEKDTFLSKDGILFSEKEVYSVKLKGILIFSQKGTPPFKRYPPRMLFRFETNLYS